MIFFCLHWNIEFEVDTCQLAESEQSGFSFSLNMIIILANKSTSVWIIAMNNIIILMRRLFDLLELLEMHMQTQAFLIEFVKHTLTCT